MIYGSVLVLLAKNRKAGSCVSAPNVHNKRAEACSVMGLKPSKPQISVPPWGWHLPGGQREGSQV